MVRMQPLSLQSKTNFSSFFQSFMEKSYSPYSQLVEWSNTPNEVFLNILVFLVCFFSLPTAAERGGGGKDVIYVCCQRSL